jgi:hypothetical protein
MTIQIFTIKSIKKNLTNKFKINKNPIRGFKKKLPSKGNNSKVDNERKANLFDNKAVDFSKDIKQNTALFDPFKKVIPKPIKPEIFNPYEVEYCKFEMKISTYFPKINSESIYLQKADNTKSNDIAIMYPTFSFIQEKIVGFKFKQIGRNYEYFMVYRNAINLNLEFKSFIVCFSHYSYFEKEFQKTRFFDRLLYSNTNKMMNKERKLISKFNKKLENNSKILRGKFILFKIPLSHWNHPDNINNREILEEKTKIFLKFLKEIIVLRKKRKFKKKKKKERDRVIRKYLKEDYSYDASNEESSSSNSDKIDKFKKKIKKRSRIIFYNDFIKPKIVEENPLIKPNQDKKSVKSVEIFESGSNRGIRKVVPVINVEQASESVKFKKLKSKIHFDFLDTIQENDKEQEFDFDKIEMRNIKLKNDLKPINLDKIEINNIKTPKTENRPQMTNFDPTQLIFPKIQLVLRKNQLDVLPKKEKNVSLFQSSTKTPISSENSKSGYLIRQAQSDTSLVTMKSIRDKDEDTLVRSKTQQNFENNAENLKIEKQEKSEISVKMIDVMNIFNNDIDNDIFSNEREWAVDNHIHLLLIHKGEFSFSSHLIIFCFDELFKNFILISKDILFPKHSKEILNFKANFYTFITEYAKKNKLTELTNENSFSKIKFHKRYRHKENSRILSIFFYIKGFDKVFYMEMDLFTGSMTQKNIISLESLGNSKDEYSLKIIGFHFDTYISFVLGKSFLLLPLEYFLTQIENINLQNFLFKMPFEITEIHVFSQGFIGIVQMDQHMYDEIMKFNFHLQKPYINKSTDEVKKLEKKRQLKLDLQIRKFRKMVLKRNRSSLELFSFRFNKLTLEVEKFNYRFTLDIGKCFPSNREMYLIYLRLQYVYVKSINVKNLNHLKSFYNVENAELKDKHKKIETKWKKELKRNINNASFYSRNDEFFCIFQHKYHKDQKQMNQYQKELVSKSI